VPRNGAANGDANEGDDRSHKEVCEFYYQVP
jgi:hypothetical protein